MVSASDPVDVQDGDWDTDDLERLVFEMQGGLASEHEICGFYR